MVMIWFEHAEPYAVSRSVTVGNEVYAALIVEGDSSCAGGGC